MYKGIGSGCKLIWICVQKDSGYRVRYMYKRFLDVFFRSKKRVYIYRKKGSITWNLTNNKKYTGIEQI